MSGREPSPAREEFARAWWNLGRRSSTSSLVAWLYAPFGFLVGLTLDRGLFGGTVSQWLALAGLGQLIVVALLPLLGWVAHRLLPERLWSWGTLAAMLLVAAARGGLMDAAAVQLDLNPPESITHWLVSDLITQAGFLILIGIRVSSRREHEGEIRALDAERRQLAAVDAGIAQRNTEIDQRLSIQMGLTVVPRLQAIDRMLDSLLAGADPRPVVTSLKTLIDDELRPLSQRLSEPVPQPARDDRALAFEGSPSMQRFSRVSPAALLRPLPVAAVVALFAFGQIDALSSLGAASVFAPLIGVLIWLLLTAAARVLTAVQVPLWWAIVLSVVITAGAVTSSALMAMAVGSAVPPNPLLRSVVGGSLLGLLSAAAALVDARYERSESFLREQIAELSDSISIARQRLWVTRRRLGYALHGSVQSALHVAAMRLSGSGDITPELVGAIRADIGSALTRLGPASPEDLDFSRACSDLAHTWEGTCTVTWQVDAAATAALAGSAVACECAIEVVLEAVQNSIRHGNASTVAIDARLDTDRVVLTVIDDGQWIQGHAGQGSRMMDELCTQWGREPLGSGTQLRAELMVS